METPTPTPMPPALAIPMTILMIIVWSIPIIIIGHRMQKGKVPPKNFLLITNIFFWGATILDLVAQAQYYLGANMTLGDPALRTQWFAFLWPITFASSLGGFFVKNNRNERIYSAIKLTISFALLIWQLLTPS